ncbi:hypothetical protein PsorP6_014596 [Peronosclerospora sorghi]|uniref:Uncharacterized protein n=1 Tax=Peronosclerospora sorghi TaxID=230839 RepID=A0ACC0VSQ6_9STRA|nr:hypothetical protein PsorP6_014596 [Peronosclerospora sorghi]
MDVIASSTKLFLSQKEYGMISSISKVAEERNKPDKDASSSRHQCYDSVLSTINDALSDRQRHAGAFILETTNLVHNLRSRQQRVMPWRDGLNGLCVGDGYEWICEYLDSCDKDLLEVELDVDGQHFFDNLDLPPPTSSSTPDLASRTSSSTTLSDEHCDISPELTPCVLNVNTELSSPSKGAIASAKPISYCSLLEEAQLTGQCIGLSTQVKDAVKRQALTIPRKLRTSSQKKTSSTLSTESTRRTTRSSSRKKFNRRLFH